MPVYCTVRAVLIAVIVVVIVAGCYLMFILFQLFHMFNVKYVRFFLRFCCFFYVIMISVVLLQTQPITANRHANRKTCFFLSSFYFFQHFNGIGMNTRARWCTQHTASDRLNLHIILMILRFFAICLTSFSVYHILCKSTFLQYK